ncbi:flagellar filament capping protein FliD [Alcaligenaceae bacterium]|nr:flagellar filament capping protein FliD [Alcaligenaceae bacterium]
MATSPLSSLGVGSGLPLDTLLDGLRKAENAPLAALQNRATKEQQRFTAYGTLQSGLDAVSAAAANLGKSQTYNAVKTSVTGDSFTASSKAGSGAIAGNYAISVGNLATAQVLSSEGTASRTAKLASGSGLVDITFTLGNGDTRTVSIDAGKSSLEDIVKAINADSELGVSATLMNDGSETPHRLMISADETGTESRVTSISLAAGQGASGIDLSGLESVLSYDANDAEAGGMKQIVAAENAQVTINGISVASQSNTIENAIEGVTLTLAKKTADGAAPDALRITRDDSVATSAVNNFVSAYNALQSTIRALTAYDVDAQQGAALSGDSLARRAQTQLRDAINGLAVDGMTLSSLGIKTDPTTGNLSVDNDKLNEALANNRADIEQLFAGEGGLSKRVTAAVEVFTKSDGLIKASQDGITRTLKLLETQYDQMEARIDQKMETYRTQFVQLDSFMAQMNSVSSYLTQQLSMLANLNNSDKK